MGIGGGRDQKPQMARTAENSLVVSTFESRFTAEDYDFWNRLEYIYMCIIYVLKMPTGESLISRQGGGVSSLWATEASYILMALKRVYTQLMRPLSDQFSKASQNTKKLWPWVKLCGSRPPDMKEMLCLMSASCRSTDVTVSSGCPQWCICPGFCSFSSWFPPSELTPFLSAKVSELFWFTSTSHLSLFCLGESTSVSASDSPSFRET